MSEMSIPPKETVKTERPDSPLSVPAVNPKQECALEQNCVDMDNVVKKESNIIIIKEEILEDFVDPGVCMEQAFFEEEEMEIENVKQEVSQETEQEQYLDTESEPAPFEHCFVESVKAELQDENCELNGFPRNDHSGPHTQQMDDPLFEYNQKHKRKRKRSKVNPASESEPSFTQLGEDLYQNDTTGIVFYRCPRCWMEFAMLKSFDQHKQQKHHQCNKCVREFIDPISLIKHQHSVHLRKQGLFRCPECGELFGNKFDFYQHEIRHCKINPLTCPMCSLSFVSERELDNHKLVHAGLLPFVCPECGKRFDNQRCLMRHQIAQHIILTDDFLCAVCGLLFSSKYQLDVHHQKDHLNIRKQFYCPDCTKSYFTAEALLKHRKKKHKTYSCTDCGKMFRKLCSLRMHDNLHKKQKRLALEQGLSKDQHDSSTTSDSPKVIKT